MSPVELNTLYVRETGLESRMFLGGGEKDRWWFDFTQAGFTSADLITVIARLKKEIRAKRRYPASLRLSTLIGNLINFEFELELCKNERLLTKPVVTPKQQILQATHRPEAAKANPVVTPAHVVEKLLSEFRASAR